MKSLIGKLWRFLESDDGPSAVEYAVMIMLIFLAVIAAIQAVGFAVSDSFNSSANRIQDAVGN